MHLLTDIVPAHFGIEISGPVTDGSEIKPPTGQQSSDFRKSLVLRTSDETVNSEAGIPRLHSSAGFNLPGTWRHGFENECAQKLSNFTHAMTNKGVNTMGRGMDPL